MDLLKAARSGNEAAFLEIFDEHHSALFRFAYRMTGSAPDAEDIVQESFLAILRPTCSYDPKRASLRTYLFGAVRNQSLKRSRQADLPSGDARHDRSPETELLRAELKDVVARAVMQLPRHAEGNPDPRPLRADAARRDRPSHGA
jgi:RNA polymerase sigma-70 factor (ECF subfamily)